MLESVLFVFLYLTFLNWVTRNLKNNKNRLFYLIWSFLLADIDRY